MAVGGVDGPKSQGKSIEATPLLWLLHVTAKGDGLLVRRKVDGKIRRAEDMGKMANLCEGTIGALNGHSMGTKPTFQGTKLGSRMPICPFLCDAENGRLK